MTLIMTYTIYFINSIDINHTQKKICCVFVYSLCFDFHRRQKHLLARRNEHHKKIANRLKFLAEKLLPALGIGNLTAGWPPTN